jgi:GalNAc-alpha-(1->4)-GalNAc-alpha-(1->3)-diNAcBac-PP-undecaprenol alpha-1,4-N-acetyl-D-galactosaminyltransferase
MRITIVIGGLGGGGAERVCVNLANAWAADGRAVTMLTVTQRSMESTYPLDPRVARRDVGWPREARAGEETAPILRVLRQEGCLEVASELPLMAALRASIVDTAPDVVISHMDLTSVRVLAAMHDTGIPVIACEHTDPNRVGLGPWQRVREVLYRRACAVIASHDSTTDWLTQRGIAARTIPNPLVPPDKQPISRDGMLVAPLPTAASPQWGEGGQRPGEGRSRGDRRRIVTMGRLSPEKRVEMLIRAFGRVAGDFPEWDLEIHGDGPLQEHLAGLIESLGLAGRAFLRGFTDDPYAVLGAADLYVSASSVEGFGNSIWEALACGVPVVAMDCGAPVRTLVRDGIDGTIVVGSEHALSVALAEVMGDDGFRETLAARAAEALQRFPMDAALRKWDAVLNDAMAVVRA